MTRRQLPATLEIDVAADGHVPDGAADYAQVKIGALIHLAPGPVLSARVRLSRHGDPAVPQPVVAQANLDVNGRLIRAQTHGDSAREAIDRLEPPLRRQLDRISDDWDSGHRKPTSPAPHEWRHSSEPAVRPQWYPRSEDERQIIRRKSFTLHRSSIDDAALDMGLLDYDFHLFTEVGTGKDSVLYRAGPTGYRLAQLTPPGPHELATYRLPVTISAQPTPRLTAEEAVNRLNLLKLPFLFFHHTELDRGAVLYHRYDGHYGLITPAD